MDKFNSNIANSALHKQKKLPFDELPFKKALCKG